MLSRWMGWGGMPARILGASQSGRTEGWNFDWPHMACRSRNSMFSGSSEKHGLRGLEPPISELRTVRPWPHLGAVPTS